MARELNPKDPRDAAYAEALRDPARFAIHIDPVDRALVLDRAQRGQDDSDWARERGREMREGVGDYYYEPLVASLGERAISLAQGHTGSYEDNADIAVDLNFAQMDALCAWWGRLRPVEAGAVPGYDELLDLGRALTGRDGPEPWRMLPPSQMRAGQRVRRRDRAHPDAQSVGTVNRASLSGQEVYALWPDGDTRVFRWDDLEVYCGVGEPRHEPAPSAPDAPGAPPRVGDLVRLPAPGASADAKPVLGVVYSVAYADADAFHGGEPSGVYARRLTRPSWGTECYAPLNVVTVVARKGEFDADAASKGVDGK